VVSRSGGVALLLRDLDRWVDFWMFRRGRLDHLAVESSPRTPRGMEFEVCCVRTGVTISDGECEIAQ